MTRNTGSFLWLSDIHYDEFYGRDGASDYRGRGCGDASVDPQGQAFCDSPLALVQSAVSAARDVLPDPDFVVVSGDLARHGMNHLDDGKASLSQIFNAVANVFRQTFAPDTSIMIALGNNDAVEDYFFDVDSPSVLDSAVNSNLQLFFKGDELNQFQQNGGYFSRQVSPSVQILVLNTVIYSMNHHPPSTLDDPLNQFAWMESIMEEARRTNSYVMLAGHIPPSVGSYRKSQFWQTRYVEKYLEMLEQFSDIISAQLFGHLHSDEFRLLPVKSGDAVPLLLASSVTPVFGGNPSFRLVEYNTETGTIEDYSTFYLHLNDPNKRWQKLYSFKDSYGVPNLNATSMGVIASSIRVGGEALGTFLVNLKVDSSSVSELVCGKQCRTEWYCVVTSATKKDYEHCASPWWNIGSQPAKLILAAVAGGVFVTFIFASLLAMCYRRRKRKAGFRDIADEFNIDDKDYDDLSLT